jgi:hypothetical protein
MITGWRYYWRRYLGWVPIQFCCICGKPYWGGFPAFWYRFGKWQWVWMPYWKDYCSTECCEEEHQQMRNWWHDDEDREYNKREHSYRQHN